MKPKALRKREIGKGQRGGILRPPIAASEEFAIGITKIIDAMHKETVRSLMALHKVDGFEGAMDASISTQARIVIDGLIKKYLGVFNEKAKDLALSMVSKANRSSKTSVSLAIKKAAHGNAIAINQKALSMNDSELLRAAAEEAAYLIRLIPTTYLDKVAGEVMRSIQEGNGLESLTPFMNEQYQNKKRHAQLVAQDQTRKVFANCNKARMERLGIKEFEWVHSGGGQHPRELHQKLDGKIFSLDNLPYIGDMYGERIYGIPAQLPNCRCTMRPVLNLGEE